MQLSVAGIGHVGITVRDIDRSVAFYERYLGMKLTEKFEYPEDEVGHGVAVTAGAFVRCDATHHELSIFKMRSNILPDDAPDAPKYGFGLHHIAFEVPSPQGLLDLYANMKAGGVEIVNARKGGPGNQPRFYVRDPDGNLLEFYWGIDRIGWDGVSRPYDPIEEIELEDFDFEGYIARRNREGAEYRDAHGK